MTAHPDAHHQTAHGRAARGAHRNRAGMTLLVIGAVILLLSLVAGAVLAVIGFSGIAGDTEKNQVFDGGQGVITLDEGDVRTIYRPDGAPVPECTVTDPTGGAPGGGGIQTSTITYDGVSWVSFTNFEAGSTGDYQVSCSDTVMVGPPVSIGGIFAGVGGILAAVFGGALGLLLVIIGTVLHLAMRRPTR